MPPVHTTLPTTHASLKTQTLDASDCPACHDDGYSSVDNFQSGPGDHNTISGGRNTNADNY